jgi:hypothetical protein
MIKLNLIEIEYLVSLKLLVELAYVYVVKKCKLRAALLITYTQKI